MSEGNVAETTTNVQAWQRLAGETDRAFAAFKAYLDLGARRSIDKAYLTTWSSQPQKGNKTAPKTAPRHWTDWSRKFHWVDRAAAFDAYIDQQVQAEFEKELIARRQKVMRQEFDDAELQLAKWHEMVNLTKLHMPQRKKSAKKGEQEIIFAELTIDDWYKLSRWRGEISDQQRRALGMAQSTTDVTSKGEKLPAATVLAVDDMVDLLKRVQQHKGVADAGTSADSHD